MPEGRQTVVKQVYMTVLDALVAAFCQISSRRVSHELLVNHTAGTLILTHSANALVSDDVVNSNESLTRDGED